MKILALDLGKFNTMCCFFDTKTRKHEFLTAATERNYLAAILKKHPCDLVVMEACGPSGWIHDLCDEHKRKTLVCSTNEDAWKWSNVKRKTDRDDALKLARMASLNELKAVHVPSPEHRELRSLIKFRKAIVYRVNRVKNSIRSIFANHGIPIERTTAAWTSGREHIDSFRKPIDQCLPNEFWKGQLDSELTQLDALSLQQDAMEKKLDEIGKNDPRIIRLKTIPGVGPRTAEALVSAIDDPHRFKNGRQVSAYLGLVPKQYQSGETDRNGRISKRGPSLVRSILVECVWVSLRYNTWAKSVYERIHGNQKTRKKKAAIAVARKIAVVAWAMLRDETDWDTKIMERIGKKDSKADKQAEAINESKKPAPKKTKSATKELPKIASRARLTASRVTTNPPFSMSAKTPCRNNKLKGSVRKKKAVLT